MTFLAVISIWGSPLYSQEPNSQAPTNRIHVVGPDGKYAPDTIVHRFEHGELVFLPDGKVVTSSNGDRRSRGSIGYIRLIDEGEGIQVEHPQEMGGMGGMGMAGGGEMMMGMGSDMGMEMETGMVPDEAVQTTAPPSNVLYLDPGAPDIFFATNPKNEFAFVPPSTNLIKKIRLRESATLTFSVPRHYVADRYVVLALWTNGFVYPQFAFHRPQLAAKPEMSTPGHTGFSGGDTSTAETGPGTSDWRFHSYVSYWQVAPLTEPDEKDADGFHTASVKMPPGEVRLTLVPKDRFEEVQHNPTLLNQLSLMGGPSRIVVARSGKITGTNTTPIPLVADGAVDLEIRGDLNEATMPDWSSDEQLIVLTRIIDTPPKPNLTHADDYIRLADSTREQRSKYRPLGIVAHPTADGTYLAVGLLPGEYHAWKIPKSRLERGTGFSRALPIELLSASLPQKVTAKIGTPSSSNNFKLPLQAQVSVGQSSSDDPFAAPVVKPSASDVDKLRKRRIQMLAKQIIEMDRRVQVAKHMLTELMRQEKMMPPAPPTDDPFAAKPDPFSGDPFGGGAAADDPFSAEPMQDPFAAPRLPQTPADDPFAP
ncbi:hypothetical protein RMSM_00065 [Rhodopirellula maiorica SM1]|uniref:Uncharacterized protein n=1 Tax=Rhodopirellula maiorica SM1 TaxID=1265738 RepID=M5S9Z4_9BACT|nr:hypothetical protein RMSM_00065 [Rhodopirellula maiorica SM1]